MLHLILLPFVIAYFSLAQAEEMNSSNKTAVATLTAVSTTPETIEALQKFASTFFDRWAQRVEPRLISIYGGPEAGWGNFYYARYSEKDGPQTNLLCFANLLVEGDPITISYAKEGYNGCYTSAGKP